MRKVKPRTPIENLAAVLNDKRAVSETGEVGSMLRGDVLVPEQCMIVYMNGRAFQVTIEPFENQEENV